MIGTSNIVLAGKEVTRGTAVAMPFNLPFVGDGLKIGLKNHVGEILASSTYPFKTARVPLGLTPAVKLTPDVNRDTIRDLFLLSLKRTLGATLPSLTFGEDCMTIDAQKAAGCVCQNANWDFSRNENPNEAALLSCQMDFAAMNIAAATVAAGTQPVARRFPIHQATFSLNSVSALEVLSFGMKTATTIKSGPHKADRSVMYVEDGSQMTTFSMKARFSAAAWRNLIKNGTEFGAVIVLQTGTANETVTLALPAAQAETHELSGGDTIVEEQIDFEPFYSAAAPVAVAFGSAIGASNLSLS